MHGCCACRSRLQHVLACRGGSNFATFKVGKPRTVEQLHGNVGSQRHIDVVRLHFVGTLDVEGLGCEDVEGTSCFGSGVPIILGYLEVMIWCKESLYSWQANGSLVLNATANWFMFSLQRTAGTIVQSYCVQRM